MADLLFQAFMLIGGQAHDFIPFYLVMCDVVCKSVVKKPASCDRFTLNQGTVICKAPSNVNISSLAVLSDAVESFYFLGKILKIVKKKTLM